MSGLASSKSKCDAIVIFGATGDLAGRMLLPSLYFLDDEGFLNADLRIIGTARSKLDRDAFVARVEDAVRERSEGHFNEEVWERFAARLDYAPGDASAENGLDALKELLTDKAEEVVFYLSTSPSLYGGICAGLLKAGLSRAPNRLVVEKPIGRDFGTSEAINNALAEAFSEDRTFRIDHYLGKETVQNLLALRFGNRMFEPLWNSVSVDHIQITIAETAGVGGRRGYYDEYGAIRDMLQNHLLQLLCLVAMEPPASLEPDSVRNEKVKVLRSLRPIVGRDVEASTVRGQYNAGVVEGEAVPGYADEDDLGGSDTESFVAIRAHIDNWRWKGVPFYLRTGKRLHERRTEIVIQFRDVPHSIFGDNELFANRMIIHLQPKEEISVLLMNKTPGLTEEGMHLQPLSLNLSLTDAFKDQRPRRRIAYERLLLDAINNNSTMFVRRDEVEAAWSWVDAIAEGWSTQRMSPKSYSAGGWGPSSSIGLTERDGRSWNE